MQRRRLIAAAVAALLSGPALASLVAAQAWAAPPPRNIVIFVADGLRHTSVTEADAPFMYGLRARGVDFADSHALFPTFTTPNASAIATGHLLGDTGDFSNVLYVGAPDATTGSVTPFLENDRVIADIDDRFGGNFLGETTLLAAARAAGWHTAAVGKIGPVLIQDVSEATAAQPATVIIDDRTGHPGEVPLPPAILDRLRAAGLAVAAPGRGLNGDFGTNQRPGTVVANTVQQDWFTAALTRAVLPAFQADGHPFALVFWSRDPDGTQHNQGDSLNTLSPGINGPTSRAAVADADADFRRVYDWLQAQGLLDRTDIVITSDHGFSTISRHDLNPDGSAAVQDYAATQTYPDVNPGFLPPGFVAIDIAHALDLPLYDPNRPTRAPDGSIAYGRLDPTAGQHAGWGNGLIGGTGHVGADGRTDAQVIVAANGGSDLIYLPGNDHALAARITAFLLDQDYTSGVFADTERLGVIPGALTFAAIGLAGDALTPRPSLVVNFRSFSLGCAQPTHCTVELADLMLQQGQGMHGSYSRADTWNNMIAAGPDFRAGYADPAPVSNADIVPTIARAAGLALPPPRGHLLGRVASEALADGPKAAPPVTAGRVQSSPDAAGRRTTLAIQTVIQDGHPYRYVDAGGIPGRTVGLPAE